MDETDIRKNTIEFLRKNSSIKSLKEFKSYLQGISITLNKWRLEIEVMSPSPDHYEKCHVCHKFLGYPYYYLDDFIEINPLYYCKRCDYIYCKECGHIHKKNHIDERRLEVYKAKKKYRRNNNKKSKQITISDLREKQAK